ncbi:MAG: tryptophan synthase subunit beta [Candidatus Magasanikbacteria bacterium CG10_big_fil_rev_8_21_14_0_10_40_10]|uniref:Multifunctional fusion protein n=1 Tax=Candidatus Magasanikbacteria bacterium CG10_big_fil_rev_8_21_14_0_10_40_10 TaxID=1974648 RepID=A0A2M6W485_9BACT|nr:MAG: tryptophan synthase subunit beta [Candidatus Magasanikbacteria bacterium CG10_big_fil_rev_8_21_14_0_10_40_10]
MSKIKICGITNLQDAQVAAKVGADYLGFIVGALNSPRLISAQRVAEIIKQVKRQNPEIKTAGVFVDIDSDDVVRAIKKCQFDVAQLHGDESVQYCRQLKNALSKQKLKNRVQVWKAVIIKTKADKNKIKKYFGAVDKIMVDSGKGSGQQIDLDLLKNICVDVLAGGLGPSNVCQAIAKINPRIVDLNSRLEKSAGQKDEELIKLAVNKIKQMDTQDIFFKGKFSADDNGYFGDFGGRYAPELLSRPLQELQTAYEQAKTDPKFKQELMDLYYNYSGRPTPLYYAANLTARLGGAKIYLKNEGLNHTGAHKINHCLGQALLAKRMGKTRLIAETGAGQHGLATATVAAKFGFECTVYMGAVDVERQRPNVFWMQQLGAKVVSVEYGDQRLKDAVMAGLQDWTANYRDSYYLLGSALGPHPYPSMVRDFQNIVGLEVKEQLQERENRLPDYLIACVGGGSNAIGLFNAFLDDKQVKMIGVEAGGKGVKKFGQHASRLQGSAKLGVVEGYKSYFLQDDDGQIQRTHSISAGLDYAGIGPQHAHLFTQGRVDYHYATDDEVLTAFKLLAKTEGILAALESCHAVAKAIKLAPTLAKDKIIVVNVSGRGDKDIFIVADALGDEDWKEYLKSKSK